MKRAVVAALAVTVVALPGAAAPADGRAQARPGPFLFVAPAPARAANLTVVEGSLTGKCARILTVPRGDLDFSPDGRLLAVVRQGDRTSSLSVVAVRSGRERVLLRGRFTQPLWSPDSRLLAVPMLGSRPSLDLVDAATARRRTLVAGAALPVAWSPDGRRLAFRTEARPFLLAAEVIGANGRGRRVLMREEHLGIGPWSPDGTSLLLLTHPRVGVEAVTLLDVGSGDARVVAERKTGFLQPAWSPDGLRIAFGSRPHAGAPLLDVYTLTVADGVVRRVTRSRPASFPTWPGSHLLAWSPRGDLVLYRSGADVAVVKPDGTGRRVLCKTSREGPTSDAVWPAR